MSFASCNAATIANGCSRLAEPILSKPTPHAVLGSSGDELLDYQLFAPAESAQLNKANDDKLTALTIIQRCEERDQAVIDRMNRRFVGLL